MYVNNTDLLCDIPLTDRRQFGGMLSGFQTLEVFILNYGQTESSKDERITNKFVFECISCDLS